MTDPLRFMIRSNVRLFSTAVLFIVLGFGIYSNSLQAPFVLDDCRRIEENPHVRMTNLSFGAIKGAAINEDSSGNRPIGYITFALDYYVHQSSLKGYHVVNIVIHVINSFLLYFFVSHPALGDTAHGRQELCD
jgi:hypothetical protein